MAYEPDLRKRTIAGATANAIEASAHSQRHYKMARLSRKSGNMYYYRFHMQTAKQYHAHYEGYRDCVSRLAAL